MAHSVMGRVLTLEISNMDKISVFDTTLVLEFMPYIHFCPKTSLPSMIFSKNWILAPKHLEIAPKISFLVGVKILYG